MSDIRFSLIALALGNFVVGLSILAPAGMLEELARDLVVGVGTAGLLISLGAGIICASPPLVAWTTSRWDRRVLLAGILMWLAVGQVASGVVHSFASLLGIRLAVLAVAGAFTPLASGTVALLTKERDRGSAIAAVLLGWALSIAIGLPLVAVVAPRIGWRLTYELIGLLAFVSVFGLLMELPRGLKGTPVVFSTWRAVGEDRQLMLLLFATSLLGAGQLVIIAFVGPLLTRLTGATPDEIALVFALFGVMTIAGNVCASRLVGGLGAFNTSIVFVVCIAFGVALWAFGTGTYSSMAAGAAIWGFGFAATTAMQQVRLIAAAPSIATASVSINNTVLYLGQAVGSGIGSVLFLRGNLSAMGFVALALIVVSLALLWLTRAGFGRSNFASLMPVLLCARRVRQEEAHWRPVSLSRRRQTVLRASAVVYGHVAHPFESAAGRCLQRTELSMRRRHGSDFWTIRHRAFEAYA